MEVGVQLDGATAIRRVNDTLQGPVIDILAQLVPDVKKLPRNEAFERTLDDIALLERCFQAFRRNRTRFKTLLVDERNRVVSEDGVPLSCGRTLDEVVAMVVRTAAKRYFRRRHAPDGVHHRHIAPRLHKQVQEKGLVHRLAAAFREDKPKHPPHCCHKRADELYEAIKAHLLHDWQVPMVPAYAEMPPTLIRALGPKLLEVRDLDHLKRITADPAEAARLFDEAEADPRAPAEVVLEPVPASPGKREDRARLSELLSPDGKALRPEAFAAVLLRPEVRDVVERGDLLAHNADILRGVGGVPAKLLVAELGLRTDQLAVILLNSYGAVGPEVFRRMFGHPGNPEMVMRITQRARAAGIGQQSPLPECRAFVRGLFARFA